MAGVVQHPDPGPSIAWARKTVYTNSLFSALNSINRQDAQFTFQTEAKTRGPADKARRKAAIKDVTEMIFMVDEESRREKQIASVGRRLISLGKDYTSELLFLKSYTPAEVPVGLMRTKARIPWWDDLRGLLNDHPNFDEWDPDFDYVAEAGGRISDEEDEDDGYMAMEGIEYQNDDRHLPMSTPPQTNAHFNAHAGPVPAYLNALHPGSPGVDQCPKCALTLTDVNSEEHLRECLDGEGDGIVECPVCEKMFEHYWDKGRREEHVKECCEGGGKEVEGSFAFVCTSSTVPKNEDGSHSECAICLEDFIISESLARLSCLCVFHEKCCKEWWGTGKGFCPNHVKVKEGERP